MPKLVNYCATGLCPKDVCLPAVTHYTIKVDCPKTAGRCPRNDRKMVGMGRLTLQVPIVR